MNIDFIMRSDFETKFGGDVLQVQEYRRLLIERGCSVRLVPYGAGMVLRADSIVHIVNIDRPYDFLSAVRKAGNRKIFVSPIHHDLGRIRLMRSAEDGHSMRAIVGRTMPESVREFLAFCVRSVLRVDGPRSSLSTLMAIARASLEVHGVWARVGLALDNVDGVALLALGEGASIQSDTGWLGGKVLFTPNGRPTNSASVVAAGPWRERDVKILMVGRIEPRKRQAEIAGIACRLGAEVTFVGDANENTDSYAERFARVVHSSDRLNWHGRLSHEETLDLMASSRVLLNASWVEVQSLVDIEAYLAGCFVVASDNGNSAEFLGDSFVEVSGGLEDLVDTAVRLAQGDPPSSLVDYSWTWTMATEVLHTAYLKSLGGNDGK